MIIQVNGQNVNVDDSYAKLSPEAGIDAVMNIERSLSG